MMHVSRIEIAMSFFLNFVLHDLFIAFKTQLIFWLYSPRLWPRILFLMHSLLLYFRNGKSHNSINDLSTVAGDPSPIKEKGGLKSVVKAIVRREKEGKSISKSVNEELCSLIRTLFDTGRLDIVNPFSRCNRMLSLKVCSNQW